MAIWNRNKSQAVLTESSHKTELDFSALTSLPYYNFVSSLSTFRLGVYTNLSSEIKKSMLEDPIISMIINMWISDALHKDLLTHEIFNVEVTTNEKTDSKEVDNEISTINEAIDYLLNNSNLLDILPQVLYQIIIDGIVSVRFGFVDAYEDTKIKLFDGQKGNKAKALLEGEQIVDKIKKLNEASDFDDYEDLRTSKKKIKRLSGRYYFEILPDTMVPLKNKGITVFYMDLENHTKVLNPKNITTFINSRGNVKTISVKSDPNSLQSDLYEIPLGQSFIDKAVTPWSMLNTVEDCTILALLTRSSIYRLFQIDVGAMSTKETENLIQEFKKRLTTRETIDVRKDYYSSAQTQIPLGDSIIIPTRNGIGALNVQSIGGDLDIKTQQPLDYFKEKLLGALGVPKTLVYGDESGQLINTSASRQDIRYLRTIQQFTNILSTGIEDIILDYLDVIGVNRSDLNINVVFAEVNNQDALDRIDFEQAKQEALDRAITSLNNLGIDFSEGGYSETRDLLIRRYLDADLLDAINKDENSGDVPEDEPAEEEPKEEEHKSLPGGGPRGSNPMDMGGPTEEPAEDTGANEIANMEVTQEDMTLPSEPEIPAPEEINVNPAPPYS